jgi:hypothetical protein
MLLNVVIASILAIIEWVILVKWFKRKIPFLDKVINDMPIIPMIAPMTNNSIITSIAPTKNSNTEIILTCIIFLGFLYQLYSKRINFAGIIAMLALLILFPNIMMLSIINDMPIIPMIAPMTNNSIITSIAPTKWVILVKWFKRKIPFLDKVVLKDSTNSEAGYRSHDDRYLKMEFSF